MSFPFPSGGLTGGSAANRRGSANSATGNASAGKNPSSVNAMFQGILPSSASAPSPSNHRQLSGLNMNLGLGSSTPSGSVRLTQAAMNSNSLGDEIKRLQQLHQLNNANASNSGTPSSQRQLMQMQGLLAGRGGMSMQNQASMLQQLNNTSSNLNSFSNRDAAAFLLMSQQQQQQQQAAVFQQQQALQQQLQGGGAGGGMFANNQAQLMAAQQQMLPSPSMLAARAAASGANRPGPGAIEPFPEKLHRMLTEVEISGKAHIISFVDEGRAFAIHKPNQFFKEIVPLYFRQSRLSSFKRQLNLYGFELISNGPSRGAYFHELFQRDKPTLCRRMRRVAVKVAAKNKQEEDGETKKEGAKEEKET